MYRTGVHSKLVGLFLMIIYVCVVMSPVNILQVVPLFFLGATLIFIGYDLMLEWLFEVRGKIFLSEYLIVWATFISIQIIGIDFGILLGVLVAVVESVVRSAHNISVTAVVKQSRAVWTPTDYKLLQEHGYNPLNPKILSLEIQGTVFFGSSLFVLEQIMLEMGIDRSQDDTEPVSTPFSPLRTPGRTNRRPSKVIAKKPLFPPKRKPPLFVVLDLSQVSNMEATGARGCFLQLAKSCARRGIIVCACGATPRIDWILRAHDVAYDVEEEEKIKALVYSAAQTSTRLGGAYDVDKSSLSGNKGEVERVLLFLTIHEALEFCEHVLIREVSAVGHPITESKSLSRLDSVLKGEETTLANVISHVLGLYGEDCEKLEPLLSCGNRYYSEELYRPGDIIFTKNDQSDAIYVVLEGAVAVIKNAKIGSGRSKKTSSNILSGSGLHKHRSAKSHLLSDSIHSGTNENLVVASMWGVGGIFGYSDCLLSRPYTFNAVCSQEKTRIAKITRAQLKMLREEKPQCEALVKDTVLQASLLDLANCTCDETYAR
jgi:CRP-like cAMP-binding protein